jgi:AcrR family transcriptional regulator
VEEPTGGTGDRRPGGRPRDVGIDERVRGAVRDSLVEVGWDRTTLRGVATRAGVSRPAISRRWPSKGHLVLDAILGSVPDLDRFRGVDRAGWIRAVAAGSFELFDRADVRAAVPGLLAILRDHDDIRDALWQGFTGPASAMLGTLDDPAAGAPDPDEARADAEAVIVLAAGAALISSLVVSDGNRPGVIDRVRRALDRALLSEDAPPASVT